MFHQQTRNNYRDTPNYTFDCCECYASGVTGGEGGARIFSRIHSQLKERATITTTTYFVLGKANCIVKPIAYTRTFPHVSFDWRWSMIIDRWHTNKQHVRVIFYASYFNWNLFLHRQFNCDRILKEQRSSSAQQLWLQQRQQQQLQQQYLQLHGWWLQPCRQRQQQQQQ